MIVDAAAAGLGDGKDDVPSSVAGVLLAEAFDGLGAAGAGWAVSRWPGDTAQDGFGAIFIHRGPAVSRWRPGSGRIVWVEGELLRWSWWEVTVEAGSGDTGLGHDLGEGVAGVAKVRGVGEFVGVDNRGTANAPAFRGSDGSSVGGALEGVGAFHLAEEGEEDDGELGHRVVGVAGVDLDGVGEVADSDAAFGELVDQVEGVADGAAESVQGVHDDDVPGAGVAERRLQPGPRGGRSRAGLLVEVSAISWDPGLGQGVELAIEVLLGGRDPCVPEIHEPDRTGSRACTVFVARVSEPDFWDGLLSVARECLQVCDRAFHF